MIYSIMLPAFKLETVKLSGFIVLTNQHKIVGNNGNDMMRQCFTSSAGSLWLLGCGLHPEDGGSKVPQNIGMLHRYTVSQPTMKPTNLASVCGMI